MPDGWELEQKMDWRKPTSNNWTMDPNDPNDAEWDADGDGLTNLVNISGLCKGCRIDRGLAREPL